MRAAQPAPAAMDAGFHQMERAAREQLEKLNELVESNPAEMRAVVRALFPEGVTITRLEDPGSRGIRLEGIAAPNQTVDVILGP